MVGRLATVATLLWGGALSLLPEAPLAPSMRTKVSDSVRCRTTEPTRGKPPDDPHADPFPDGLWYINGDKTIWAGWDVVHMVSGQKGNKVLWIRPQGTQLEVSGRRLDAQAPPPKAHIPCCYPTGFQASGLVFPTEGCWEVSAKAGMSTLVFVTSVAAEPLQRKAPR